MAAVQQTVVERMNEILDPNNPEEPSFNANTYAYQFSDAHILAVPQRDSTRAGAEFVAMWCRLIAREYFKVGLLVRGGVTIGKIYCADRVCFGPALTRAYKLEQSVVLPMIILDPSKAVQGYFFDEEQYGMLSDDGPFTYNYFAKTKDGRRFIDFLRHDVCTDMEFRPIDVFEQTELKTLTQKQEIVENDNLDVRMKKTWFLDYANGSWRNKDNSTIRQINFQPQKGMRRRLIPGNYAQDFGITEQARCDR